MTKKRIGVIGPGKHFTKKIYPILKKSSFFQLDGVLRKKNKNFKNIKNFDENYFFKKNFDFIYISCPNFYHERYIIKALEAGAHVICEKPFLLSKKKINKIINLSKKNKKLIFEGFMYLYHPAFQYVKKIIKNKEYGNIRYIVSNFRFPSLDIENNRYKSKLGSGFFFDAGSYLVSLDLNLFKRSKTDFYTQKIKKKVDLRGSIFINSSKIKRYYFWGEGQIYSNNIEIFFTNATVFIDNFFSKNSNQNTIIKIFKNNKIKNISLKKTNHFIEMFLDIEKNYKKISYKKYHRRIIKDQLNNLIKYKINSI